MGAKDELAELRRLEELEAKASGAPAPSTSSQPASLADKMLGGWGGRMALGMASPLLAGAQMLGGETGRQVVSDIEAAKRRGMAAEGKEGTDWYGILGALLPSSFAAGAVTKALPAATGVLGRAGVGAAQGAAVSAATPVTGGQPQDFWSDKATQVGTGATVGGLIPLAFDAVKGAGGTVPKAVEPLYEKGRAAILQRYQESLLGDNANTKQRVIHALTNAKELVPGSKPTAGEALAALDPVTGKPMIPEATGLMAHQQSISKMRNVSPEFARRAAEQEAARATAIGTVAKTPGALEQAIQDRATEASKNYGLAAQDVVKSDKTLKALLDRPSMTHIMQRAENIAKEQGQPFKVGKDTADQIVASAIVGPSGQTITRTIPGTSAEYPVESLHYMKLAMDDLLKDPDRFGIGATEVRAIAGTKKEFLSWLESKSPAYSQARTAFKTASGPINRMEVGQQLEKALESPLGTGERSAVFANAVREAPRTIKKATGQSIADDLSQILNPQEVSTVNAVAEDLARKDAFQRLARGTKISGSEAIPGNVGVPLPNLLSRPAMIANFLMRHAGQSAEDKIAKVAAQQYLNPAQLAMGLQPPVPPRYQPVIDALMRQAVPGSAMTTARQF